MIPWHPPVLGESEVLYASRGCYEKPSGPPNVRIREGGGQEGNVEEAGDKPITPQ